MKVAYIVMGVSGSGKTTIGRAMADRLGLPFFDGDDFHPQANIDKMSSGTALTDDDRWPWLDRICGHMESHEGSLVLACSALKEVYRQRLLGSLSVRYIYLRGNLELIHQRMQARDHFMPVSLLQSQFDTLEPPAHALIVDIDRSVDQIIDEIMNAIHTPELSEVGLVGLGVMGTNLARNIASRDISISIYNRHVSGKEENVAVQAVASFSELSQAQGFDDVKLFIQSLERPRRIILMITAGPAVDYFIEEIRTLLSPGDILVDGGNSFFEDTERRSLDFGRHGIHWVGSGISGGAEGALRGPSIMPGGDLAAVQSILPLLKKISARDEQGHPCTTYVGAGGSGHFVKMVHNGIEYAEMQLIAEVYDLLCTTNGMSLDAIADIFQSWNVGEDASYLLEITIDILRKKEDDDHLLDKILDQASNKGTGSWTTSTAAKLGVAVPNLTAALNARYISSDKQRRTANSKLLTIDSSSPLDLDALRQAYRCVRMCNHLQGFDLIENASSHYDWKVDRSSLAQIWTNGCIIRSALMVQISKMDGNSDLFHAFAGAWSPLIKALQQVVATAATGHVAVPCLMTTLTYLQSIRRVDSAANVIQAQRDYFGAHTYRRIDDPSGASHHTEWTD